MGRLAQQTSAGDSAEPGDSCDLGLEVGRRNNWPHLPVRAAMWILISIILFSLYGLLGVSESPEWIALKVESVLARKCQLETVKMGHSVVLVSEEEEESRALTDTVFRLSHRSHSGRSRTQLYTETQAAVVTAWPRLQRHISKHQL